MIGANCAAGPPINRAQPHLTSDQRQPRSRGGSPGESAGALVSLQTGRGLAAVAVAAFHLSLAMGDLAFGGNGVRPFADIVGRGYLGVDFFFVLSGFIILQAHDADVGQLGRAGRYVMRRFMRIYPIYWIYLTACVVGMAIVGSSHLRLSSATDLVTMYGLVRITPVELPLAQAWTLFHEVVFYAIFAVLLLNLRLGLAVLGLWAIAIVLNFQYAEADWHSFRSAVLAADNLNFLVGMLAFLAIHRMSKAVAWVGLFLALGLFGVTYHLATNSAAPAAIRLGYGVSFGALLSSAVVLERLRAFHLPPWLGFVGDASYSIYLLHEHVENYTLRALMKVGIVPSSAPSVLFVVVLAMTVLAGCAAYVLLERPLLRKLRARFDKPRV